MGVWYAKLAFLIESGCKSTTKFSNMQIFLQKSSDFFAYVPKKV